MFNKRLATYLRHKENRQDRTRRYLPSKMVHDDGHNPPEDRILPFVRGDRLVLRVIKMVPENLCVKIHAHNQPPGGVPIAFAHRAFEEGEELDMLQEWGLSERDLENVYWFSTVDL